MSAARGQWSTGLATLISVDGNVITVRCPHCGGEHRHGRGTLGSKAVVAGCHRGYWSLLEYRIPKAEDIAPGFGRPPAKGSFSEPVERGSFTKTLRASAATGAKPKRAAR